MTATQLNDIYRGITSMTYSEYQNKRKKLLSDLRKLGVSRPADQPTTIRNCPLIQPIGRANYTQ